jgi:hypothetical protein
VFAANTPKLILNTDDGTRDRQPQGFHRQVAPGVWRGPAEPSPRRRILAWHNGDAARGSWLRSCRKNLPTISNGLT